MMKTLVWVGKEEEPWNHHHHFAPLVEDLTGISMNETMCPNVVKYMAKRLKDTPYHRRFRSKYSIFENEYKTLVEKFNTHADNDGRIEVK